MVAQVFEFIREMLHDFRRCNVISYIRINFFSNTVEKGSRSSRILNLGHAVIDLAPSAEFHITGIMTLNEDLPKGSRKDALLQLKDKASLSLTGNFQMYYDSEIAVYSKGKLNLGYGYMNAGSQIRCMNSISIGNRCAIGRNVLIMDYDAHSIIYLDGSTNHITLPILIGDHVWIGAGATILKGVTIGDHAVIGAGAIVTKDVRANTVVAGVPAKEVHEILEWR